MNSKEYAIGFMVGLLTVVIVFWLIGKRSKNKCEYDERQIIARGKAFKAAYVSLFGYLCLTGVFDAATGIVWADFFTEAVIGLAISATVFAVNAIIRDAYVPLSRNVRGLIIVFLAFAAINISFIIIRLVGGGSLLTDGKFNVNSVTVIVSVMMFILSCVLGIKQARDKKQLTEDEE